jgi:hypothetical protein
LSEEDEISQIKMKFFSTIDAQARKNVFDALAKHGNKGEEVITELMGKTINDEVKAYGSEVVRKLKSANP